MVVEPLQCTKTKGREGVRVRGWVERQRKKEIEEMEERESKIQKGGISTAKRYVSRERSITEKCRHSRVRERDKEKAREPICY